MLKIWLGGMLLLSNLAVAAAAAPSSAEAVPMLVHITATEGREKVLLSAPCVRLTGNVGALNVSQKSVDGAQLIAYTPTSTGPKIVAIDAMTGAAPSLADGNCPSGVAVRLLVTTSDSPAVPDAALGKAFNILMAAFVLSLLMESAFAMLFNWRVFQEFFVGRAWRTIIMFAVSLLVVRQFNLDLLASLFDAYQGTGREPVRQSWTTSILTAMIIGGGSAGVNRLFVALGFRSQMPKVEEEQRTLTTRNLAYISVTVSGRTVGRQYRVEIVESECTGLPNLVGIIAKEKRARLRGLLFASSGRFPRSGGHALDASRCYRISVTDMNAMVIFDMDGRMIKTPQDAAPYRFKAGAIIDFDVPLLHGGPTRS